MLIKELCCNGGFSDVMFYKWCVKFGGMQVFEVQCLCEFEFENVKFKWLLVEVYLDMYVFKSVLGVKCQFYRLGVR